MDNTTKKLVQAIHDSQNQLVFVAAGAGTQALTDLLNVAGASRTLLEAIIPYSQASFNEFLGQTPTQYVTDETSRLMAGRAYTRAHWLQPSSVSILGLSCTATIVTDRLKRGEHRAFLATWQPDKLKCVAVQLEKGVRDRTEEEAVVSRLMLNLLADSCELAFNLPVQLSDKDILTETLYDYEKHVRALLNEEMPFFSIEANGRLHTKTVPPILLSGSFNPLHDGHLEMAQAASNMTGKPVAFELPATNADKPPLPKQTVLHRLAQFAGRHTVYASAAPTFIEKSRIYPGTTFVVGYDTALRILQPRFYQDSHPQMLGSLSEIERRGCSFLVVGRVDDNGRFQQTSDLPIPEGFQTLFQSIPFRKDISSTELRNAGTKGSR